MNTNSHDTKLAAAKAYLGKKWLFHPSNRVQRQPAPLVLDRARSGAGGQR
ncbi:MAG: hypothetical protein RIS35_2479 [Pseudomonadota bacterium]|jgi:hypothetical protein